MKCPTCEKRKKIEEKISSREWLDQTEIYFVKLENCPTCKASWMEENNANN